MPGPPASSLSLRASKRGYSDAGAVGLTPRGVGLGVEVSNTIDFKPFDPRLRSAMAEIEKVLEKHNVGGQVDLVSKTHVEFRFFPPKWAPHTKDIKAGRLVWHFRKDNPEGNNLVAHVITAMHEQTMRTFLLMDSYYKWLHENYEIEHTRGPVVRAPEDLDPEPSHD